MNLAVAWTNLASNLPRDGAYFGAEIQSRQSDFIARSASGAPILFIKVAEGGRYIPSVRLKHIAIDYLVECRIRQESGHETLGQFAVFSCESQDANLQHFFLASLGALLDHLPCPSASEDLQKLVDSVVELFRALERPSQSTLVGLWGELLLLLESRDVAAWAGAWHDSGSERFDYSFGPLKVEVKTTITSRRVHEFSLGQLLESEKNDCWIASVVLTRSASGLNVLELADLICARLREGSAGWCTKIWRNVSATLGADFEQCGDARFDVDLASESVLLFNSSNIARPAVDDARIDAVRFSFDASQVARDVGQAFKSGVWIQEKARSVDPPALD